MLNWKKNRIAALEHFFNEERQLRLKAEAEVKALRSRLVAQASESRVPTITDRADHGDFNI